LKTIVTCKFNGLKEIKFDGLDDADIAELSIYQVNNILQTTTGIFESQELTKLEIQGITNQLFCINGEEIRLGRR
jgi:hypothetical protein